MLNRSSLFALLFAVPAIWAQTGATAHIGNAVRLMQQRKYAEAATEFEAGLATDPNNDAMRIQYATCLFAEERNDDARRQFEIEQKRVGEKPGITYYLGMLDLRAGSYLAAIARLKPLEANAVFPKAAYYLGMAYLGAGRANEGMQALQLAAKSLPGDAEVHYRLARMYTAAGQTEEAAREYQLYRAAHEDERIAQQQVPLCIEALRTQSLGQAKAVCDKIGDPHNARRLALLGELYAEAGGYSDALEPLERASRLEPGSFEAWHYLGLSLYALKRYPEALAALKKAEALSPQYFDTVNLLAKTLYAMGDYRAALPVLERAHNLNPGDTQLAGVLERLRITLASPR